MSASPSSMRKKAPSGGEGSSSSPEFVLRSFGGMNNLAAREAINDDEFWWLENLIPVAPGALYPVNGISALLVSIGESGAPSYTYSFNMLGTDYIFAVWSNSGNAYIISLPSFIATQIVTGSLTSGQTCAAQWSNLGLLIVDPAGYWDYNITTAATLTSQVNGLLASTLVFSNVIAGGTSLKNIGVQGTGTGGTARTTWAVTSVAINAAGTGYAVGDVLTLTDGSPTAPATIQVTSVGAGNSITGISLTSGGAYPGPAAGLIAVGPTGGTVSGGSGTGATFTTKITTTSITITSRGFGYTGTPIYQDLTAGNVAQNQYNLTPSGVVGGTQVVVYSGRAWISNGRTVYFTDVNSYFSFGGSGGQFTITDSYLHKNITALFSANNYLYIFGDDSIDALSNVTVSASTGVTTFTRLNITQAVGTSQPESVQSYYRSIGFHHASGLYLLSGATPEKISEKISGVIGAIILTAQPVVAANVLIQVAPIAVPNSTGASELCAAWLFQFTDTFSSSTPQIRSALAIFFRGRWFIATMGAQTPQQIVSVPIAGVSTLYFFSANSMYQAFSMSTGIAGTSWLMRSKLWDASSPLKEKQAINAAAAFILTGTGAGLGVNLYVDTEYRQTGPITGAFSVLQWINQAAQALTWQNQALQTLTWTISPSGYYLFTHAVTSGNSQYVGLTLSGSGGAVSRIDLLGLRGKQDRNMLL